MVKTKVSQTIHLGKYAVDAAIVRLVAELREKLDEAGLLGTSDKVSIDNVITAFIKSKPESVREELRDG